MIVDSGQAEWRIVSLHPYLVKIETASYGDRHNALRYAVRIGEDFEFEGATIESRPISFPADSVRKRLPAIMNEILGPVERIKIRQLRITHAIEMTTSQIDESRRLAERATKAVEFLTERLKSYQEQLKMFNQDLDD